MTGMVCRLLSERMLILGAFWCLSLTIRAHVCVECFLASFAASEHMSAFGAFLCLLFTVRVLVYGWRCVDFLRVCSLAKGKSLKV